MSEEEFSNLPILWRVTSASGPIADRPGTDREIDEFARESLKKAFERAGRPLVLSD